jgi:protein-L-isoaspartate(D-aspartate) O-methyltransferase
VSSPLLSTILWLSSQTPNPDFLMGNSLFSHCFEAVLLLGDSIYFVRRKLFSGINTNKAMVAYMQKNGVIRSKKVAEVMETIDRALFIPDEIEPYHSRPVMIQFDLIIPAPNMHSTCLQLLEEHLQPGMHALDVGSGNGYLTACFALMVGPRGCAVGLESMPGLVSSSVQSIQESAAAPLLRGGSLSVHFGDGRVGWPQHAPYDAIHVIAEARDIPQEIIDQLKPGGRLVWGLLLPGSIVEDFTVIDKKLDGSLTIGSEFSVGTCEF